MWQILQDFGVRILLLTTNDQTMHDYGYYENVYTVYTAISEKIGLVYCLFLKNNKHQD